MDVCQKSWVRFVREAREDPTLDPQIRDEIVRTAEENREFQGGEDADLLREMVVNQGSDLHRAVAAERFERLRVVIDRSTRAGNEARVGRVEALGGLHRPATSCSPRTRRAART